MKSDGFFSGSWFVFRDWWWKIYFYRCKLEGDCSDLEFGNYIPTYIQYVETDSSSDRLELAATQNTGILAFSRWIFCNFRTFKTPTYVQKFLEVFDCEVIFVVDYRRNSQQMRL